MKVYEGIWKYMKVYKVYPDILNKSSTNLDAHTGVRWWRWWWRWRWLRWWWQWWRPWR